MNPSDTAANTNPSTPPETRLWSVAEVADFLQVSAKTVYNLRKAGLPYIQLGGTIRFTPEGVKEYLARHPYTSLHRLRRNIRQQEQQRKQDNPR